jgi:hypothetical protein
MSLVTKVKDAALERALLMLLEPMVKRYGRIKWLSLDTRAKTVAAEITLHGDAEALELSSATYRVEDRDDGCYVILSDLKFSKAWVQHLVEDHFRAITLRVPPVIRPLIR